jgi:SAM-dependent methyltransferase
MTAIAAERAEALGLRNVRIRELDLEQIDEPDRSYDVVVCREGLMLVPDPARAAREIARVLRPGGRVAVAVWGAPARNPWLAVVFEAVGAQLGVPMPPPGLPGPFSLDDPVRLGGLLTAAGLTEVEVSGLATPYHAASVEEWWTRTVALAGPLAQRLAALPEPAARALAARAADGIRPYETAAGLDIPGLALIAAGVRTERPVPLTQ